MIVDNTKLSLKDIIKFRTINNYDPNLWSGQIVSFADFDTARIHTDIQAYHHEVLKDHPTLPPAKELTYIVIITVENKKRAFAIDWIEAGTLKIIDPTAHADIRVFNLSSDERVNVLRLLRDNGYETRLI